RRDNNRNHRRVLVVDGRLGLTGGSGVSEKWTGDGRRDEHWRDTDLRLEGPAVRWLQAAFAENWRETTHEILGGPAYFPPTPPAMGDTRLQIVRSSPTAGGYAVYTMLLLAMASARRSFPLNDELNVAIYDAPLARRLEQAFDADLRYARRLEYAAWQRRGLKTRLLEALSLPFRDVL